MNVYEERVIKIIAEKLGLSEDVLVNDASFVSDLGADELDVSEMITALEKFGNIELSDAQAAKITTVQAALDAFGHPYTR